MNNINEKVLVISLLTALCFVFTGFTYTGDMPVKNEAEYYTYYSFNAEVNIETCFEEVESFSVARDCTVRIKTDDIDIELTLHDVSRWKCFKMKVRAVWARITGDI